MLRAVSAVKSNKLSPPSTCLRNNLAAVAYFYWSSWNVLAINLLTHGKNNTGCRQICNTVFKHLFLMFQYLIKQRNSCFWFACRHGVRWDLKGYCLGFKYSPIHSSKQHLQAQPGYIFGSSLALGLQSPKSPSMSFALLGTDNVVLLPNVNPGKKPLSLPGRELLPCHLQSCSCKKFAGPVLCNVGERYKRDWAKCNRAFQYIPKFS